MALDILKIKEEAERAIAQMSDEEVLRRIADYEAREAKKKEEMLRKKILKKEMEILLAKRAAHLRGEPDPQTYMEEEPEVEGADE